MFSLLFRRPGTGKRKKSGGPKNGVAIFSTVVVSLLKFMGRGVGFLSVGDTACIATKWYPCSPQNDNALYREKIKLCRDHVVGLLARWCQNRQKIGNIHQPSF